MVASIAILLLISIGVGVQKDVTSQVENLGVNLLICVPGRIQMTMGFNPNLGGQSWFKESDREDLMKVEGVRRAALLTFAGGGIEYNKKEAYPMIIAATPEWFQIHTMKLKAGRLYDNSSANNVCVLGGSAAEELFGKGTAIGKKIKINQEEFEIIGVSDDGKTEQSMFSMQSMSNVAYYPYKTHKKISTESQIDRIMVQTDPEVDPKSLVAGLEGVFSKRLERSQYTVLTQEDLLGLIYSLMSILSTLVIGLTSIALFVGGVGIMTVMIMSVNERRKEIGVRKALGAKTSDIFRQILWESVMIGTAGVLAGLVFSSLVAVALASFTKIKPIMNWDTILLAFIVGIGVGAISGLIPAVRAARVDPVVSLRNE